MKETDYIYIAGHSGLVGSAIHRNLVGNGYCNIICRSHRELDLTDQAAVGRLFDTQPIDYVFLAAARVGGIHANNTYRGEFIYQNLMIQSNVIHAAKQADVKRLVFLGSSCIYPRDCPQPMREDHLLSGPLESTNEPYAVAKIAGVKLCEAYNQQYGTNFISLMPTNLYGPADNFDLETSHVIPAVMRKVHDAKRDNRPNVTLWGTGTPLREFLYVDDLASACVHVMRHGAGGHALVNVGSDDEVSIRELAEKICGVVDYRGELCFDTDMPDGTPRKRLDSSRIRALGWRPAVSLRDGLARTYQWFVEHYADLAA